MMATFYGVYVKDPLISAAIDLVRFLAEPDALRFSHITLRGPYTQELTALQLEQLNDSIDNDWSVYLGGAGYFFAEKQSTVMLRIELNKLKKIVKKPDFKKAVPHVTLYDGGDRDFAKSLLEIIYRYDFYRKVWVTKLRKIDKKAPLAGSFYEFYPEFLKAFYEVVGTDVYPSEVASLSSFKRLELIEGVLDVNFDRHSNKLAPVPQVTWPENLDFGFPHDQKKIV